MANTLSFDHILSKALPLINIQTMQSGFLLSKFLEQTCMSTLMFDLTHSKYT